MIFLVAVEIQVDRLDPAFVGLEGLLLVLELGDESLEPTAASHRLSRTLLLQTKNVHVYQSVNQSDAHFCSRPNKNCTMHIVQYY